MRKWLLILCFLMLTGCGTHLPQSAYEDGAVMELDTGTLPTGITMECEWTEYDLDAEKIVFLVHNNTDMTIETGVSFSMEVCTDGSWSGIPMIENAACIHVYPYGAITVGEKGEHMADLAGMAPNVIAFSDDGKGVQDEDMMRSAMLECKRLGKILAAHCEDNSLLHGGYIHDGEYAKAHGHRGICSESEWGPIARDLKLAKETGCAYHVCHISTKESVDLIRRAKAEGVDVTCETGPHYILMSDQDLQEDGRFKMNPPLRSEEDRKAILEGILDGTIDMIATDHAPHSAEEKGRGLEKSAMGVVGIETAFPLLYTHLVKTGLITLERLVELMAGNPRKRFGIEDRGDFSIWDLSKEYTINPEDFLSKGRATPFAGWKVSGENLLTIVGGNIVWQK